nr:MAG TPA: hypothetical protein [Caudoviricetes sp.]
MRKIINMLKKDENAYSIGRVCALIAFVLWAGLSLKLALLVETWGNYETLTMGMIALMLVQLGNKAIETRAFKISSEEVNKTTKM